MVTGYESYKMSAMSSCPEWRLTGRNVGRQTFDDAGSSHFAMPARVNLYATAILSEVNRQLRARLDSMGWHNAVIVPVHLPQGKTSMRWKT